MNFGARQSQYGAQAQGRSGQQRKAKKEEPHQDEFIRLTDAEIAMCISDIGVPFSTTDIQHPQPQQIQRVFEWFAELIMNTTRETVEPAMRAAARDVCGGGDDELVDIVPAETRNLMGFYVALRRLLVEVGVTDFCFADLTRPTHARLSKIFSYLINFVRFREQEMQTIETQSNRLAGTKQRIEDLHTSNANLAARLDELRANKQQLARQADRHAARNEENKQRLLRLRKEQEATATAVASAKATRDALTGQLGEMATRNVQLRQDCDKLRPYAVASGRALQNQLSELHEGLNRDKTSLARAEKRVRALDTSANTFALASADVEPCVTLLGSLQADLNAEEVEAADAAKRRDALSERSLNVKGIEHEEEMLQIQLRDWVGRTDKLRRQAEERSQAAGKRMRELGDEHKRLMAERGEKGREVERRKVRVEQTEKKMADLKENIENEVNSARDEYMKMDAHIRLYITEMEQSI